LAVLLLPAQESDLSALQQAVRSNPSDPETHARLGMLYRRMGRLGESAASLEQSMRLKQDPRVGVILAFTYMESARHGDAIPLLSAAFESGLPENIKGIAGQRLVECYLATGGEQHALPVLEKLRRTTAEDPNVLYLASKLYMNLWNSAFALLVAKAPNSYQAHLIQAEALEAQERFAEAAHEYRQILTIAPEVRGMHYRLGGALLRSGSADAESSALAEFRKEIESNPGDVASLVKIGEIQLKRGQRDEAIQLFSDALKANGQYFPARIALAKALIVGSKWSEALGHLEVAAKLDPADEATQYNLMLVYRGLGREDLAKKAADNFQNLRRLRQGRPSGPRPPLQP
jgi:tetratricopeptide (TPR) repeat protein